MRMAKLYLGVLGLAASALLVNCLIPTREASCGDGKQCTPAGQDDGPPQPEPPMPECTSQNDCLDAKACVNQKCVVCSNHDDCTSRLCEPQDDPTKPNRCLDPSQVYIVDGTTDPGRCGTPDGGGPDGSVANPFCTLQSALAMPARNAIRLVGSRTVDVVYVGPFDLGNPSNATVRIFGSGPTNPEVGRPVLTAGDSATIIKIIPASSSIKVTLDGVSVRGGSGGVDCNPYSAAQLTLITIRRSVLSLSSLFGLKSHKCLVTVTRSMFRSLPEIALYIDGGSYTITDNFMTNNGGGSNASESPITLHYSSGIFAHNTILANISTKPALGDKKTMNCDNVSSTLQASIIISDPKGAYISQFTGACALDGVVVHPSESYSSLGKIPMLPSFTQIEPTPFALQDDLANSQCCIDKVQTSLSATDYFGTKRSPGTGDIGAHEVR